MIWPPPPPRGAPRGGGGGGEGREGCYSSGWDKDLWSGPRLKAASIHPLPFSSKQNAHRSSQGNRFTVSYRLPALPRLISAEQSFATSC